MVARCPFIVRQLVSCQAEISTTEYQIELIDNTEKSIGFHSLLPFSNTNRSHIAFACHCITKWIVKIEEQLGSKRDEMNVQMQRRLHLVQLKMLLNTSMASVSPQFTHTHMYQISKMIPFNTLSHSCCLRLYRVLQFSIQLEKESTSSKSGICQQNNLKWIL